MLKLRNKLITVLAVLASLLILSGAILLSSQNAIASQATLVPENDATIETSFVVGMEMDIPNANIKVGDELYSATTVYMREPNGSLQTVDGSFKFEKIGLYALVYTAEVNGKLVSVETEITVDNTNYNASNVTTFETKDNLSVVKNSEDKGIHVTIPYTDKFVWNTPVNLAETGLNSPLISFLPYQYSLEKAGDDGVTPNQATEIYVRLTDAYNKEVYVDVRLEYFVNAGDANQMPSYSAGAAGKPIRALSENLGRDEREGVTMNVGNGRYFVTYPDCGGYPHMGTITPNSALIDLFYDVETNQVYVGQEVLADTYKKTLINDVDAPEVYGENAFAGFTTGEVYVSIFANRMVNSNSKLDVEIASIGNMEGEALFSNVAKDTTAPNIKVDVSREQVDNGIFVAKGQDVAIFDYDVKDVNFTGEKTSVKVLYNDNVDVTITNGKFKADKIGKYTVIYTAEDDFGNVAEKKFVFLSTDRSANDNKLIEVELVEYSDAKKAGTTITLPEVEITSLNTYVNKTVYALFGDSEKPIAIDFDNPTLKLENVGEYTIVYEYSDIFESGSVSYTFTTEAGDAIEFVDALLPKYFIKNANYSLDRVYAKTYTTEYPQLNEVAYRVSYDGGNTYEDCQFSDFLVGDASSLKFEFSYGGAKIETSEISIVDVGFSNDNETLDKSKYFVGDFSALEYNRSGNTHGYVFKANTVGQAVSMDYAVPLSLDNFSVNFKIPNEYKNVKSVEFKLTDYLNQNNSVTIAYANSGSGTSFEIVGQSRVSVTKAFVENEYRLEYSATRGMFIDNLLGLTAPWSNSFESSKVLLTITLKDVTGDAGIVITHICDGLINNTTYDDVDSTISFRKDFEGSQSVGTEVTIFAGTGNDIFSPAYYAGNKLTVSVTKINSDGSRTTLTSTDGILLNRVDATRDYNVILTDIASYQVYYQYEDQAPGTGGSARKGSAQYTISTLDELKPVITIDGGYDEFTVVEAEIDTIATAQGYTVTDNLDKEEDLKVCVVVIDPYFTMYDLIENDKPFEIEDMKFELKYRGEYVVYYYAEDTTGNVATASYRIFVK